jgi:photosystem II stability/assembly factor-like uncharacterized protein
LDFRDVEAFDADTAYLLAIGPGDKSRIYRTDNGGKAWRLQFQNTEPKAFFDGFAFWDKEHGIAFSDPVAGKIPILATDDGEHWRKVPAEIPAALEGEGAFAGSGTSIRTLGKSDVWIVTGGASVARMFHSSDRGLHWTVSETPIHAGADSAGAFSVLFTDDKVGYVSGGDYKQVDDPAAVFAWTDDGGKTWTPPVGSTPGGLRECIVAMPGVAGGLVAVGPNGSDYSLDNGRSWSHVASPAGLHSASFAGTAGWAVGAKGLIAKWSSP